MHLGAKRMQWAIVDGERFEANPILKGIGAKCPCCDSEVRPKCGSIVEWHWAHKERDCDPWSEPESEWHREWKDCFPSTWQEVIVGNHRADIKTSGLVIELQNSLISPKTIQERESFYGNMIWIVNAQDFAIGIREHVEYVSFRWKWPRKSWWHSTKPLYFDLGIRGILQVKKIHNETPCGGWGVLFPNRSEFLKKIGIIPSNGFESLWTNNQRAICDAISGVIPNDNLTDYERLELYAGEEIAELVESGSCNRKTYTSVTPGDWRTVRLAGVCGGRLKMFHSKHGTYLWCSWCNRPPEYKGEPLPKLHPKVADLCEKFIHPK